jgi:hypothetical protein
MQVNIRCALVAITVRRRYVDVWIHVNQFRQHLSRFTSMSFHQQPVCLFRHVRRQGAIVIVEKAQVLGQYRRRVVHRHLIDCDVASDGVFRKIVLFSQSLDLRFTFLLALGIVLESNIELSQAGWI